MSDKPLLQLPVAKPLEQYQDMILLSIVVDGHVREFHLSRQTAAALISALAGAVVG